MKMLSKKYGISAEDAQRLAESKMQAEILKLHDDFITEHGLAADSPVSRGLLLDLLREAS
jgi:hypothetical protein